MRVLMPSSIQVRDFVRSLVSFLLILDPWNEINEFFDDYTCMWRRMCTF